jgi:Bacterial SH3 domain
LTFDQPFRILVLSGEKPAEIIVIINSIVHTTQTRAMLTTPRHQRSSRGIFGKIVAGMLVLTGVLSGAAWIIGQFLATRDISETQRAEQSQDTSFFEYTVTAEARHMRVSGTTNFPNGVILIGTLAKVGSEPMEVKEALVMNRLFAMEFGPERYGQSSLLGPQDALQAGVYHISVDFDPAQQSPFAREALLRWPHVKSRPMSESTSREIDPAIIRISKTVTIGTADEQHEAQTREQQHRQTIRQHLGETLGMLTSLWQRLRVQYQQERSRGGFSRGDLRANEWGTWSAQWLNDLKALEEKAQLYESASPAVPYHTAHDALVIVHKQLAVIRDLYFEVLTNERSPTDRELQRTQEVAQYALWDATAQLGQPASVPTPVKIETVKPTVVVTSPLVNVRSGPGISHEMVKQVKKDDILDFLGEQGEWFQVQLGGGRTGWIHRNVASKRPQGDGTTADAKRMDSKLLAIEKGPQLQLEPLRLLSTPLEYIPRPTPDEIKIYADVEVQLRDLQARNLEERKAAEQRILQRMSDKYIISPEQIWNTYLKVQGWEIKR